MVIKFIFDRLMALIGLLVLWPVLLVVAVLIRIKMPGGSVIFTQKRVGRNGRLFTMYKFRSMTVGHGGSSVSVAGESRITPLGAKLRHYKLDELPELWNVLIGDMSFVGPRPDVPGYADSLTGKDRKVLELRPGITGPASLKYRDEEDLLARQSDWEFLSEQGISRIAPLFAHKRGRITRPLAGSMPPSPFKPLPRRRLWRIVSALSSA